MSMEDYRKAYKAGKREYQSRLLRGQKPTLEVLDDILPNESLPQENLGLVQIPLSQIVGTRYEGNSAFSEFLCRCWKSAPSSASSGRTCKSA